MDNWSIMNWVRGKLSGLHMLWWDSSGCTVKSARAEDFIARTRAEERSAVDAGSRGWTCDVDIRRM